MLVCMCVSEMWSLNCCSAMHGFGPIEFSNGRLGTSHEFSDIVMFGLAFLSASIRTANLVTPKFQANKRHPTQLHHTDIHKISTRYKNDFRLPSAQSKLFQKGVFCSGIRTYKHLPLTSKELSYDVRRFRRALKRFSQSNSFYSLEEYFVSNWK